MKVLLKFIGFAFLVLVLFGYGNSIKLKTTSKQTIEELSQNFKSPPIQYRPETWFHLNGNNISKEGLTLDLEAIKSAGLQGIQLFNKAGRPYPNVEQIKILSPEWEDMIRHAANECKRLGLKFTMQNCPGWSMTGGPWVPVEEAQREIVESVYRISGGRKFTEVLELDTLYQTADFDYKEVQVLAFPTPKGDIIKGFMPSKIETNNNIVPWEDIFNPNATIIVEDKSTKLAKPLEKYRAEGISKVNGEDAWVKIKFDEAVTVQSIVLPPFRHMIMDNQYPKTDVKMNVKAFIENKLTDITTISIPNGNWNDRQLHLTLALPKTTSNEFVLTFEGSHIIAPEFIRFTSQPRLHNHEAKAAKALRSLEKEVEHRYAESDIVKLNQVLNITDKLDTSGKLNWDVPKGEWTVVRFGHINMRRTNKPAVPEATGWEASKLDKIAIENHLRNGMIGNLIKDGGPIGDGKLNGLLIDSWESYIPSWTMNSDDLFNEFEERRGYSMKPYLPATMGYVVESVEVTTKFLRDLRHTMDEVYIDNFFKHFATVAHKMGAEVYTEGAGGEVLPIDPMRYYGVSDIPMTEFWYPKAPSSQNEYAKPIYSAASATHLYNKPMLAAEACTQVGVKWNEHPFSVKYLIDYNFAKGVNHLVFHTFSHTPQKEVYPGSSFGGNIGFPFLRQQTWWKYMPEWIDYLARNQYMLQQGEYVADVLWYYGDHFERPPFDLDYFPKGYRFDYLNTEILHDKLSVKDARIHVKDAGDYRVILLRDSNELLLSTLIKLKELVLAGAVILGDKPMDSPSLMDDANDLNQLHKIADELWGTTKNGVKQVGKGRVHWGKTIDEVLKEESVSPDVIVPEGLDIHWIHRKTKDADIYFIASKHDTPLDVAVSFKQTGVQPQIWNAFNGEQHNAMVCNTSNKRTNVALSLDASGSAMVVFLKGDKKPNASKVTYNNETILSAELGWYRIHHTNNLPKVYWQENKLVASKSGKYDVYSNTAIHSYNISVNEITLQNNWKASFEAGWDTPASIETPILKSLTQLENDAVKHYSGTVVYAKEIALDVENKQVMLDLGEVANIAELWCNGKKVGIKWAPPFVFDLTNVVKKGSNQLVIKVTNTWRNQLIFDNNRPINEKKTWTTSGPEIEETELEVSGLIGPVILKTIQ